MCRVYVLTKSSNFYDQDTFVVDVYTNLNKLTDYINAQPKNQRDTYDWEEFDLIQ